MDGVEPGKKASDEPRLVPGGKRSGKLPNSDESRVENVEDVFETRKARGFRPEASLAIGGQFEGARIHNTGLLLKIDAIIYNSMKSHERLPACRGTSRGEVSMFRVGMACAGDRSTAAPARHALARGPAAGADVARRHPRCAGGGSISGSLSFTI